MEIQPLEVTRDYINACLQHSLEAIAGMPNPVDPSTDDNASLDAYNHWVQTSEGEPLSDAMKPWLDSNQITPSTVQGIQALTFMVSEVKAAIVVMARMGVTTSEAMMQISQGERSQEGIIQPEKKKIITSTNKFL